MVDLKRAVIPLGITAAAALLLTLLPDVLYNVVGIAGPISQKTVVGVGLVTYTRAEPPPFSLEYPPLWTVEPPYGEYPQDPRVVAFNGMSTSDRASFVVVAVSLRQYSRYRKFPQLVVGDFLCGDGECQAQLGTTEVRGQWELGQFTQTFTDPPDVVHGVAWWRQQGDSIWLLYGFRHEAVEPMAPLFQGMVDSWQPDARFTPSPPTAREVGIDERNFAVTGFVLLFAAFGAAISLVRARRARRPPSTAALFLFVTGVVVSLRYFDLEIRSVAGVLGFPERSIQLPHLSLSDLQAWVAFGTIVFLGWLFVRSRHTFKMAVFVVMLLVLNSGLQVVAWISGLYGAAQDVEGRFSIAQAVVVLLALLWDLSLSGQSFTNVRTRVLPRHSAVMLYLAYLLLVATEILYWSSLRSSQPIPNSFESDQWPALGLLYLGIPYLICWFVLRLGRWSALQAEARSSPTRN